MNTREQIRKTRKALRLCRSTGLVPATCRLTSSSLSPMVSCRICGTSLELPLMPDQVLCRRPSLNRASQSRPPDLDCEGSHETDGAFFLRTCAASVCKRETARASGLVNGRLAFVIRLPVPWDSLPNRRPPGSPMYPLKENPLKSRGRVRSAAARRIVHLGRARRVSLRGRDSPC